MERISSRYEKKMIAQHLAPPGAPVFGERDAEITWNRSDSLTPGLSEIFARLNINTLLFSRPAEPYCSIIASLIADGADTIFLADSETRLFLHDIPVVRSFSPEQIAAGLMRRKCVIVKDHGVMTCSTVSPEQTFINFSSALFACFVKFFAEFLADAKRGGLTSIRAGAFERIYSLLPAEPAPGASLTPGPFTSEAAVLDAMCEAGVPVVARSLVDSAMGNISYRRNNTLYISQTGSFLDELSGCIDPCPLDDSLCTGITASSELPTHMQIVKTTPFRAILHGHPKFSVIMSMICDEREDCPDRRACHISCPKSRSVAGVPVVCGESGTGRNAIVHTVPEAMSEHGAAVVYGHGVFAAGEKDFNAPFSMLYHIERTCRGQYAERLKRMGIL